MDIWVIWVLLLDVVQATRVWFQDGCVMEHLVESDAQKDHVELEERNRRIFTGARRRESERGREEWEQSLCVSCYWSIHFKSGHFVAQSWNSAARLGFPLCQTEHKILWNLYRTKQGSVRRGSCTVARRSLSSDLFTLVSSYSHLQAAMGNYRPFLFAFGKINKWNLCKRENFEPLRHRKLRQTSMVILTSCFSCFCSKSRQVNKT